MTEVPTFNVIAATGAAGSQADYWGESVTATQSGSSWLTGKYWENTDPGITSFYASNAALTFNAAGPTVTLADCNTDVVCAHLASPTYHEKNTLVFDHITARVGAVTIATQSTYALSAVSATLKDGVTGGTYNLRTGAWSAKGAGSDKALGAFSGTTSSQASSNDLWLIPGEYSIEVSYTLTKGDYVKSFTKTGTVTLVAGKINTINATAAGGDAAEIVFGVSLNPWVANDIDMGWDEPNYIILSGNASANNYRGTVITISSGFTISDPVNNPVEVRFEDGIVLPLASTQGPITGGYNFYYGDIQSTGIKDLNPLDYDGNISIYFSGGNPSTFTMSIQM